MSHWAGVSLPTGNLRTNNPIPVTWVTETAHEEQCRAWIELKNAAPADNERLDAAIAARDWSALGQRLYDAADSGAFPGDVNGESRVGDALGAVIRDFARETLPNIARLGESADADALAVDVWGFTCANPQ